MNLLRFFERVVVHKKILLGNSKKNAKDFKTRNDLRTLRENLHKKYLERERKNK